MADPWSNSIDSLNGLAFLWGKLGLLNYVVSNGPPHVIKDTTLFKQLVTNMMLGFLVYYPRTMYNVQ